MNNVITNQLASYRSRLAKLDEPLNKAIWENQAPLIFTVKVEEARTLTEELADLGSRQSAPTTGVARDKRREEEELEDEAYALSRALVVYARDMENESLAAKYDLPISGWRRLRAEALLERVRLLEQDAGAIVAGDDSANAELYGINAAWLTKLKAEADSYEEFIVAPQAAISDRSVLTATLPAKSRETRAKFEQLEALVLQFGGTPDGDEFVAMFLSSGQIIDRGHGPGTGGGGGSTGSTSGSTSSSSTGSTGSVGSTGSMGSVGSSGSSNSIGSSSMGSSGSVGSSSFGSSSSVSSSASTSSTSSSV